MIPENEHLKKVEFYMAEDEIIVVIKMLGQNWLESADKCLYAPEMRKRRVQEFAENERIVSASVETDGDKHCVTISIITYDDDCGVKDFEEVKFEE
jgi:hypothetical protein